MGTENGERVGEFTDVCHLRTCWRGAADRRCGTISGVDRGCDASQQRVAKGGGKMVAESAECDGNWR